MDDVLVVGAGMAGLQTVVALRDQGHDGRVTLLGAETHPPYDRPPLSKEVLAGKTDDTSFDADLDALHVDLLLGCTATALRTADHEVDTDAGPRGYDRLVIATGARVVTLPGTDAVPGVHTLRTVDDAIALRAALVPDAHVVVVGAGWIGAEVATAAAAAGCHTTVVEALAAPLAGAFPSAVGELLAPWYAQAGVELRTGARVDRVEDGAVHLTDGTRLPADAVVVGIGVRPDTAWLTGSGLELDPRGGVCTDGRLCTSDPHVYAVGDCASFQSARYGVRLNVEHWDNALQAPRVAVANLLGGDQAYDPVPYFWSDQFGRMVQYAGHHPAGNRIVHRGSAGDTAWTTGWFADDRLVALMAVARPRDLAQGRRLIQQGTRVDLERFADPAVQLKNTAVDVAQ